VERVVVPDSDWAGCRHDHDHNDHGGTDLDNDHGGTDLDNDHGGTDLDNDHGGTDLDNDHDDGGFGIRGCGGGV
jgi:hypothetical protein